MGWLGGLDRVATALERIGDQLTRIGDQLGAPAIEVTVPQVEDLTQDLAAQLTSIAYRDDDLLLRAQGAEETLGLLLGRAPTAEEIDRVLAVQDG